MKSLLMLVGLALAGNAFAGVRFQNSGGRVLGEFSDIRCQGGLNCRNSGGYALASVNPRPIFVVSGGAAAVNTFANPKDCGSVYRWDSGTSTLKLPEASLVVGCDYTFINNAATTLGATVIVDVFGTDDIIRQFTDKQGDSITTSVSGSSVSLWASDNNNWHVRSSGGSASAWTDNN